MSEVRSQGRIISIDEGLVKSQLGSVVRETVDELNYTLGYSYYEGKSRQAERIGDIY